MGRSVIINAGRIVRTGAIGVATFFAEYRSKGGSIISSRGLLEFHNSSERGGLVVWNNTNGGSWMDPNNWVPALIFQHNDIVHITLSGRYVVVIPDHVNVSVTSLTVGLTSSFAGLVVGRYSQLFVSDRLDLYSENITVNGVVTAKHVTWRGQTIQGSNAVSEIVATDSMEIIKGSYAFKYLSNVTLTTWKSLTIDSSLNNASYYLYCVLSTVPIPFCWPIVCPGNCRALKLTVQMKSGRAL